MPNCRHCCAALCKCNRCGSVFCHRCENNGSSSCIRCGWPTRKGGGKVEVLT